MICGIRKLNNTFVRIVRYDGTRVVNASGHRELPTLANIILDETATGQFQPISSGELGTAKVRNLFKEGSRIAESRVFYRLDGGSIEDGDVIEFENKRYYARGLDDWTNNGVNIKYRRAIAIFDPKIEIPTS